MNGSSTLPARVCNIEKEAEITKLGLVGKFITSRLFTMVVIIIMASFLALVKFGLDAQKQNLIDSCKRDNVLRDGINVNKQVFTDFLIYQGHRLEEDAAGDKDPAQRKIDLAAASYHFTLANKQVRVFRVNCEKAVR